MKLSIKIVFWVLLLFISYSCRQKTSPVGYEGSNFLNGETDAVDIEAIFSLVDTTYIAPNHSKLIVGNINNTESRVLLHFNNLISDTLTIVEDPKVTLYIKNLHINEQITLYYAPIIRYKFKENNSRSDNYPSWVKPNSVDTWVNNGGDYNTLKERNINILNNQTEVTFPIDKEIVSIWAKTDTTDTDENYGLILYTNNASNAFIEFHSQHINTYITGSKKPKITIKYAIMDTLTDTTERLVSEDAFIYNTTNPNQWDPNALYISNYPPRSLYTKFAITPQTFNEPRINTEEDIQLYLNVIQATLILTVDKYNSVISDSTFSLTIGIPDSSLAQSSEKFDNTNINPPYLTIMNKKITDDYELHIDIQRQLEYVITNQTQNNGILLINLTINEDFSYLRLFGLEDEKKPRINIKYSIYDKDI